MCHNNNQRNQDIENSHNRNQNSCDLGNLLASSKDADSKGRCQHSADNERRSGRIVEAVCPEGIGDIESRYHVETAHIVTIKVPANRIPSHLFFKTACM